MSKLEFQLKQKLFARWRLKYEGPYVESLGFKVVA